MRKMLRKIKTYILNKIKNNLRVKIFIMTFFLEIIVASMIMVAIYFIIPAIVESKKINTPDFMIVLHNELQKDVFLFPMLIMVLFIFSLIGSYFFSGIITEPLIKIIDYDKFQMSRKKEFIGAISHDLKTPITVISGQLEGMIYNVGKYKDRDYYLKKCYEATQEMRILVDKMLEISKNEIFDKNSSIEEVFINDLVNKSIEKHKFIYEQKDIKIIKNIRNTKNFYANKTDINIVLNNIISNAILYSPEHSTVIVTINEERHSFSKYSVVLTVENTGVSLTKEQLSKIFDPLYRVDSSRNKNTGGSGFGLYFVSHILNNYGFNYKMFSRENSTVFTIEFLSNNINFSTK